MSEWISEWMSEWETISNIKVLLLEAGYTSTVVNPESVRYINSLKKHNCDVKAGSRFISKSHKYQLNFPYYVYIIHDF